MKSLTLCRIPKAEESFDKVSANHVLFYLKDLDGALEEVRRVLKPDGTFSLRHLWPGTHEGDQPAGEGV